MLRDHVMDVRSPRHPGARRGATMLLALAASAGLLLGAMPAMAVIEEIIVTATKRPQRLLEVPSGITAFTAEDIENASFSELGDIGGLTSNLLTIGTGTGTQQPIFVIRGITSQSGANSGFSPPLGVYVDEVYMGRDRAFNQILNDIDRIEVLKGPQGTLFGRNTTGGAISLTTRKPGDEFEVRADATYGVDDLVQLRGSVGGPIVEDTLSAQLSAVFKQQDGFLDNPTLDQDLNESDEYGGRVIVVAQPSETLLIEISADYYELDNNPAMETVASVLPTTFPVDGEDREVFLDFDEYFTREMWGASGRVELDIGGLTLTSISGYREFESTQLDDSDGKPTYEFVTGRDEDSELFTQEVRLSSTGDQRFDWLVGGYYLHEEVDSLRQAFIGSDFPTFILAPALGGLLSPIPAGQEELALTPGSMETTSYAAFAHGDFDLTDRLTLSGGARYTSEEKEGEFAQSWAQLVPATLTLFPPPVVPPIPLPGTILPILFTLTPPTEDDFTDNSVSFDVALSYELAPDVVGYAKFARGFKAGGFNLDVISPPNTIANQFAFDPEEVDNYEVGVKGRLFDDRMSFGFAVFYLTFDDKQERIVNLSSFFVTNAAEAEIYGGEFEFLAQVTDNLSFFGNIGLLESEFEEFPATATTPSFTGNELPFAPNLTGSLNVQYSQPLPNTDYAIFARLGADYVDEFFTETDNSTNTQQADVTLVNARIGVQHASGRVGLFLWGRNLTDETILGSGTDVITITTRSINRGREWGLELRFNL